MQIVECVPNFSEGRDDTVIGAIAEAISAVAGGHLLDVDSSRGANRTVMTFVGTPEPMLEAAFRAIRTASEMIDMRCHRGAHARLGATDVCPFVPLHGIDMSACVQLAEQLGERVARELDIPVFLYANAAKISGRRALPDVRRGEYEGLITRFSTPGSEPDYGKPALNERAGATIIGARDLLIAFNVNLDTKSKQVADRIAAKIRQSGRLTRDLNGNVVRNEAGEPVREPGTLKAVRSVGWFIEDYDCVQVSTNLIDFRITSLHQTYEEIKRQAAAVGVRVVGSEIIGCVPRAAMLEAGKFYTGTVESTEGELIKAAIKWLGLENVRPFSGEKKILEYRLADFGVQL